MRTDLSSQENDTLLVGRPECNGEGGQKREERFFLTLKLPGLKQGPSKFSSPPPPSKKRYEMSFFFLKEINFVNESYNYFNKFTISLNELPNKSGLFDHLLW